MMRGGENLARRIIRCSAPPFRDEQRGVHGSVERGWCVAQVFELEDARLLDKKPPNAASRQGLPELHGEQQRQDGAWAQQPNGALDEEGGEVDLRRKSASGAGPGRTALPRPCSEHAVLCSQHLPFAYRDSMQSHPGWVPEYDVEASARGDVREVDLKREGQRAATGESAPFDA
jgi:hypothetical protein